MAALGKQFITIDGNLLPETSSFDVYPEMVENVMRTEAGTTASIIVRASKRKFSVAWEGADDTLLDLCETFCSSATVTLAYGGYIFTVRARHLKETLVRYSNRYKGSAGLWNLSFDMEVI